MSTNTIAESKLISHEIILEEFQLMLPWYLNVTDNQTDKQTTCRSNTWCILCDAMHHI